MTKLRALNLAIAHYQSLAANARGEAELYSLSQGVSLIREAEGYDAVVVKLTEVRDDLLKETP